MELNEKICEILSQHLLTPEEICEKLPDYSTFEISQAIITDSRIKQVNGCLHDSKIRFTLE